VSALALISLARALEAHEFDPGVLAIVEAPAGSNVTHRFRLTQPTDTRGGRAPIRVRFPARCLVDEEAKTLRCEPSAFGGGGPIAFEGLATPERSARMLVSLRRLDGTMGERVVEDDAPFALLEAGPAASPEPRRPSSVFAFAALGCRHLLGGPDHLAFLLGLLALVRRARELVLAITVFSLGHALSLGLAVRGLIVAPTAPVEALIALSVVLVAHEALRDDESRPTLVRRAPFVVSLLFGLLHGLGFASALGSRGFPREGLLVALSSFHLGIEVTQLAIVALAAAAYRLAGRWGEAPRASVRVAALYAFGVGGAFWTFERVARVISG
jgi:hypothetical protein